MKKLLFAAFAALMTCAPALAQNIDTIPTASTLTGAERLTARQGAGCPTRTNPCATVAVTPTQIATFIGTTSQPADADLTAIAALATQPFGRLLLTQADAASARTTLGITNGGSGTVTSFAFSNGAGITGTVTNASTTPTLALTLGAITPTSVTATGAVTGSNLLGTNTGDQTSISGNAGTATALQASRTLAITGDLAWTSPSFNGSGNVTAAGTLATVNANVGSFTNANITVDAKGRVTAAANGTAGGGGGSGTVTSVSVTTANGVSGTVATNTTTPAISLTLGAITPTSVSATGTVAGSNITTAGNTIGNAASATKLLAARTIAGSSFDGTANITIADTALTGAAWTAYTPTLSCQAGSLTSASATGRFKQVGKTVYVQLRISITTNGSCATGVIATLPVAAPNLGYPALAAAYILSGREDVATGLMLQGLIPTSGTAVYIYAYNQVYPGGDGRTLVMSGTYEAA